MELIRVDVIIISMSEEKSDSQTQEPKNFPLKRFTLEGIKTAVGALLKIPLIKN
jgi:hypothetical protein